MDYVESVEWLQKQGRLIANGGSISLRRWLLRENTVVLRKFKRGWIKLRGLPFHLWNENQLWYIMKSWGKVM